MVRSVKTSRRKRMVGKASLEFLLCSCARSFSVLLHQCFKSHFVYRLPALNRHLERHLKRKSVCSKKRVRLFASDWPSTHLLKLTQSVLQSMRKLLFLFPNLNNYSFVYFFAR